MVDDKTNQDENQLPKSAESTDQKPQKQAEVPEPINESGPIFESVPVDPADPKTEPIQPEEISPEVTTPTLDDVSPGGPNIPSDVPPPAYEEGKGKFVFIGVGIAIFLILMFFFLRILLGGKSTKKEVVLSYWGLWEEKQVLDPLIEKYRKKYPNVKIDYVKMSPFDYREKLLTRSKNGTGPDIFRFHNTWLPQLSELVSPLPKDVMSNEEFNNTFYKIHQKDLKVGELYYGLPLTIDGLVMIYNENLLKKSGIQSAPTNWDELLDDVVKMTVPGQNGQIITSGIALGTASNIDHFSDIFSLMLLQNGGDIKNLNSQEAAGTLESYRKFAEEPNNVWDETLPNSVQAFIEEKVAIIFAPSWQILSIKAANPDIQLKVAQIPSVPASPPLSVANYWVEGVSKYSKNQVEAWRFLRFLTEKENLTELYELESKLRLFGEPYSRVDLASLITQNEYIGIVIKQADSYVSVPAISRTYDNGLNDGIVKYLENAINATINGVSYKEALKTASQGVDQILQQYRIQ